MPPYVRIVTVGLTLALLAATAGCSTASVGEATDPAPSGAAVDAPAASERCDEAYLEFWESTGAEVEIASMSDFPLDGLADDFITESCLIDVTVSGVEAYMGVFVGGIGTDNAIREALVANGYAPEEGVPDRFIRGTDSQVVVNAVPDVSDSDPIGTVYGSYVLVSVELGVVG